ncbi:MAG: SPOR domain-containing protein [Spirochaetia bacterium]
MEQKKLLWIIFSVTLFLAVVVGAGFIWFYPDRGSDYTETTTEEKQEEASSDFDPVEWVRSSDKYPGLGEGDDDKEEEEDGFIIVYGENGEQRAREEGKREEEVDIVSVPELETEPEPEKEPEEKDTEKPKTAEKSAAPKTESTGREEKSRSGTGKTIKTVEYWIQAGSYNSKNRAEKVGDKLDEKGFTSKVEIKEIDNTVYYRVRIGPYQNKKEANKFLNWVKDIKDFEKSYVSEVYKTKVVQE